MTRDDLQKVINMAAFVMQAYADDEDDYAEDQAALKAVRSFHDNERSTWMEPAGTGVDAVEEESGSQDGNERT